jgi:GTP-binding protein EngB required for normal cell division
MRAIMLLLPAPESNGAAKPEKNCLTAVDLRGSDCHLEIQVSDAPQPELARGGDCASRLLELATSATELGSEHVAGEASELAARLTEGRFFVAFVGQFKRGKSTLIGALIGESILPTGFVPVTAVPTVIRYGGTQSARIRSTDGAWREIPLHELEQYVSEEHNPENIKEVAGAEVFVPSPLLAKGMCLVDTPGLGSVFSGNTATTQAFIPHIDAALVVTGSDPPLAGEELALVESVAKHVGHLIVVLNKADKATDAERAAAIAFTRRLLAKRLQRSSDELVFEVSAAERLEKRGPERDWGRLVHTLEHLVQDSGRELIQAAGDRGIQRLSEELLAIVCEDRNALLRPVSESERRIAAMNQTMADAERSLRELGYLLMGEQQRLSDFFLDRRKAYLVATLPAATQEFETFVRNAPRAPGPAHRRHVMREAQEIARRRVTPWLQTEEEEGEQQYRMVARRFAQMGNDFLTKLAGEGIPELGRMIHALDPEIGFRVRSEFRFRDFIEIAQPASPLRWLADLCLGLCGLHAQIDRDAQRFLEWLLEVNSSRVQSDVRNRVEESRNRLEVEIRKLLHEVRRIAEQALRRARKAQDEGVPAVEAALGRLNGFEKEISAIRDSRREAGICSTTRPEVCSRQNTPESCREP